MIIFPNGTKVGKNVPKNVFYKHLEVNTKMKRIFVNDVECIIWGYKFAPSTLNVSDGKNVHEIAVFDVEMKAQICPEEMFVYIDRNIPRHTLFILHYENKTCAVINYKEEIQGNSPQPYKVTKTYVSGWHSAEELCLQIQGTSMDSLYENFVRQIASENLSKRSGTLKEDIIISQEQEYIKKEIKVLKNLLASERQPQKKFMLHKQLKELENKLL